MKTHTRPKKFSDPQGDFIDENSQQMLRNILETPDNEMGFGEFDCIFQGRMPAGTYEECVYFLPTLFRFFKTHEEPNNLIKHFIVWVADNREHLIEDGYFEVVLSKIFEKWASYFLKFNTDGRNYEYVIQDFPVTLIRENFVSISRFLEEQILPIDSYPKAAWFFMFLSERQKSIARPVKPRSDKYYFKKIELIKIWSLDFNLQVKARSIIQEQSPKKDQKYWQSFFREFDNFKKTTRYWGD